MGKKILTKMSRKFFTKEMISKTNLIVNIRVDKGIEDVVQVNVYEKT